MLGAATKVKPRKLRKMKKDRTAPGAVLRIVFRGLLSGYAVGNSRGNGNTKILVLVGLHHQQKPKNQPSQPDEPAESDHRTKPGDSPENAADDSQPDAKHGEPAENHNRLRRLEFHPRPLVDQQKNNPTQPAQHVAQQASNIFLYSLSGRRSSNRWRTDRYRGRGRSRSLICAAFRTERRRTGFLTTCFAECHWVPPGLQLRGSVTKSCQPGNRYSFPHRSDQTLRE